VLRSAPKVAAPFRRLFFDIETSLQKAVVWGTGKQYIGPENITDTYGIICISWKWQGEKVTHCRAWESLDDKALLEYFVPIMHSADQIVAHNGDRFDTPWIRTRCLLHGIPMSPEFVSIDTLKAAWSRFRFPKGSRLDAIAEFLGLGRKIHARLELWKGCLAEDPKALNRMMTYNRQDVRVLEAIYEMMAPYLLPKTHRGASLIECPDGCGKTMTVQKRRPTAKGSRMVQLQCRSCGTYLSVAESRYEKARKAAV
jgi:uncharacterized protein YprB with RNaseH-like and TPR domain